MAILQVTNLPEQFQIFLGTALLLILVDSVVPDATPTAGGSPFMTIKKLTREGAERRATPRGRSKDW